MSENPTRDQAFLELFQDCLEDYIAERRTDALGRRVNRGAIEATLARTLGISHRQLTRYRAGDYPFPADLIPPFCKFTDDTRLIEHLAFQAELALIELPSVEEVDDHDLVDEMGHTFSKFSRLVESLSALINKKPSEKGLATMDFKAREAVNQMLRTVKLYRAAVEAGAQRRRQRRRALAAGQGVLFGEEEE